MSYRNRDWTVGVMFRADHDGLFPTVRVVAEQSNYLNPYSVDLERFGEWLAIAWSPRPLMYDDESRAAMDETNFVVVLDAVGGDERVVTVRDYGRTVESDIAAALEHGAAVLDWRVLAIDPDASWEWDESPIDTLRGLAASLEDYPLLDEESYSAREWDAWQEWAPTAWHDEIRDAVRDGLIDEHAAEILEEIPAGDALGVLEQLSHYSDGFSSDYGPPFIERVTRLGDHESDGSYLDAAADAWRALVDAAAVRVDEIDAAASALLEIDRLSCEGR